MGFFRIVRLGGGADKIREMKYFKFVLVAARLSTWVVRLFFCRRHLEKKELKRTHDVIEAALDVVVIRNQYYKFPYQDGTWNLKK